MESSGERLDSWKEIADYLKRDVRTVQRWEATESLPVHRLLHLKRPTVYAFRDELDAWLEEHAPGESNGSDESARRERLWRGLTRAAAIVTVLIAVLAVTSLVNLRYFETDEGKHYVISTVTSYPGHEDHATFSPGGDQVAFAWDGGSGEANDLWVKQVRLGTRLRLTETPEREYSPAWAQDGSVIAFLRDQDHEISSILLIPPLGGDVQKVGEIRTPERLWGRQLTWSPGGGSLLTTHREPGGSSFIVAISTATGERTIVSTPPAGYLGDHSPAFSPDGNLVFVRSIAHGISDLYLYPEWRDTDKQAKPRRLTSLNTFCVNPIWIDSNTILFSTGIWPNLRLVTTSTAGKVSEPLPFSTKGAVSAAYSKVGGRLIFTQTDFDINIWRLALGTDSGAGQVAEPFLASSQLDWLPEYSRKGDRIIFSSQRSGWEELWLSQSDGEDLGPVTRFQGTHCGDVSWSPDDKRVAFHSCVQGSGDIYVKDAKVCLSEGPSCEIEPCCLRRITVSEYDDFSPSWSNDGNWIYFASYQSGHVELWKKELEGGDPVQVTQGGGAYALEDAEHGLLYFSKWDQPGIWRMPIEGGPEEQVVQTAYQRFGLVEGNLYYVLYPLGGNHHFHIRSRDLATGEDREIIKVDRRFASSFAVAPDASSLLWAQFDRDSRDLMLVEGF